MMMMGISSAQQDQNPLPIPSTGISHRHILFNNFFSNCCEVFSSKIGTHKYYRRCLERVKFKCRLTFDTIGDISR